MLELDLRYNGIVGPMFPHSLALFQKVRGVRVQVMRRLIIVLTLTTRPQLRRLDLSGNCFRMGSVH